VSQVTWIRERLDDVYVIVPGWVYINGWAIPFGVLAVVCVVLCLLHAHPSLSTHDQFPGAPPYQPLVSPSAHNHY
jgi:hypothetical protein